MDLWKNSADIAEMLEQMGSSCQLAELHGLFVGVICAGKSAISAEVLEEIIMVETVKKSFLLRLSQFIEAIHQNLQDESMCFQPLLPDDSEGVAACATALGEWCAGFVYGYGLGGSANSVKRAESAQDLLADMLAISQIDTNLTEDEAAAQDLMEVVEYIRVAVMDLYYDQANSDQACSDQENGDQANSDQACSDQENGDQANSSQVDSD